MSDPGSFRRNLAATFIGFSCLILFRLSSFYFTFLPTSSFAVSFVERNNITDRPWVSNQPSLLSTTNNGTIRGRKQSETLIFQVNNSSDTTIIEEKSGRGSSIIHDTQLFSIVINTFRNRDTSALHLMKYYVQCRLERPETFGLDHVILVWNDFERPVPENITNFVQQHPEHAIVEIPNTTHLSNRFRLFPSIRTDAIFSTDDDEGYSCEILEYAMSVWLQDPERMVGFAPRRLAVPSTSRSANGYYDWRDPYREAPYRYDSLFVTKGGFLHRRFHQLFFDEPIFSGVRGMVDTYTTGEDFLMATIHGMHAHEHLRSVVGFEQNATSSNNNTEEQHQDLNQHQVDVNLPSAAVAFAVHSTQRFTPDIDSVRGVSLAQSTAGMRILMLHNVYRAMKDRNMYNCSKYPDYRTWLPPLERSETTEWCVVYSDGSDSSSSSSSSSHYECGIPFPANQSNDYVKY